MSATEALALVTELTRGVGADSTIITIDELTAEAVSDAAAGNGIGSHHGGIERRSQSTGARSDGGIGSEKCGRAELIRLHSRLLLEDQKRHTVDDVVRRVVDRVMLGPVSQGAATPRYWTICSSRPRQHGRSADRQTGRTP